MPTDSPTRAPPHFDRACDWGTVIASGSLNRSLTPLPAMKSAPLSFLSIALLAVPVFAAESSDRWNQTQTSGEALAQMYPNGRRASDVIGLPVRSSSGADVGRINDLVVDPQSGELLYGIVNTGGVLGIGGTRHIAPMSSFQYATDSRTGLELAVDEARWVSAPKFVPEELASLTREERARQVHEFYGADYSPREDRSNQPDDARSRRELALATALKGKEVMSGGQALGQIEDLLVDLRSRRAALLFDPADSVVRSNDRYVVPFSELSISHRNPDTITSTIEGSRFTSADNLSGDAWTRADNDKVYRWAPVEAAEARGNNDAQVAQRTTRSAEPAPVENVRRAIQSDERLRETSHNIDVVAQSNRLVIRGTVPDEQMKDQVEDTAEGAARGWAIDNQLRVDSRRD